MELVKLTIDGREVEVPAGTTVLQAAEQNGIDIPRLCYDPILVLWDMPSVVVEIEGMRNLSASCKTTVWPDMVVKTASPDVRSRRTLNCWCQPSTGLYDSEKMGDCRLADYCYEYGIKESPFRGAKQSMP